MFIRFTTHRLDEETGLPCGVFSAAYRILDGFEVDDYLTECILLCPIPAITISLFCSVSVALERSAMRNRFEIYCDILYWGLLQIRSNCHDTQQCFVQADHLRSIPDLLQDSDDEDLHCVYWEATRPAFIHQSKLEYLSPFQQLWDELEEANMLT